MTGRGQISGAMSHAVGAPTALQITAVQITVGLVGGALAGYVGALVRPRRRSDAYQGSPSAGRLPEQITLQIPERIPQPTVGVGPAPR